ncbi:MAG TPA: NAD-dependent epimerase/dehydratase family protein [Gemmatimonadales bacterium]|nr:NAD-dependent epimerase/dehydratase family protein [Gemmatimonadales bacterium]
MTRVVVTGAAGFIGSHVVEALTRRGDEVVGIDNFDPFYPRTMKERNLAETASPRFAFREQDLLDADALAALLSSDTVLVHLAAKAGVRPSLADPVGYARVNVTGTASVVEAARRAGVSRLVFGSSSSVYGDSTPVPFREDAVAVEPVSPYAATKRAGELLLHSVAPIHGLRVASLRFFTVYGPRQRPDLAIHAFARRMAEGRAITLFGDGTQSRDYTYCDDIVAGVLAAIDWTGSAPVGVETFNLGGNRTVRTGEMVEEISRALGITPTIEWAPMQPGDVQRTAADLTKSGRVLGYAPRTPFPEGIRRFAAWFREVYGRAD